MRVLSKEEFCNYSEAQRNYLSYSRLRTFDHCNRYYYYHYELGLPTEPSFEAEYSSLMIHAAIAALYKGDEHFNFADQWKALRLLGLKNPAPGILTVEKAIAVTTDYWQRFGLDDLEHHEVALVERKVFDDTKQFQSIPDVVLRSPEAATLLILDHKVATYNAKPLLSSFNRQLISQALVVSHHLSYPLHNIWIGINSFVLQSGSINREIMPLDLTKCQEYNEEYETKRLQISDSRQRKIWSKNAPDACVKYYGRQKKICEFWKRCEGVQGVSESSTSSMPGTTSVSPE